MNKELSGKFTQVEHEVDLCVVGGGMAGLCAALAAARRGAKVALMHDRPVLGGNASSETRVHICGADRHGKIPNVRETGILEELRLENLCRNPNRNFSIWDLVLYESARFQPNLTLLLNCSCLGAEMDGDRGRRTMDLKDSAAINGRRNDQDFLDAAAPRIAAVSGWQLTTQTVHRVRAKFFADCSGDAILAPLTGAQWRMGREARSEYGESIAPEQADARTMGMTCLFQSREYDSPQPFHPPAWAERFEKDEDLPYGARGHRWWEMGYWWVELGGEQDSIRDTESLRDELLKIALGLWDHIKNHGDHGADNWALEWLQFLPAKRESRRYVGEHVLTQGDIESGGKFGDLAAYGGWSMDDHHPAGFRAVRLGHPATIFHPSPSPYGIPYRALYSRNVANLLFAGRCASCTHAAMSSTRVMGTGCSMGQAVGTAAALAVRLGVSLRDMNSHIEKLQQALIEDDCYLPGVVQKFGPLTTQSPLTASQGDPEPLRDGINRPVGDAGHGWNCKPGDSAEYRFGRPQTPDVRANKEASSLRAPIAAVSLVFDSALDKIIAMSHHQRDAQITRLPEVLVKSFRIEGFADGKWRLLGRESENRRRSAKIPVGRPVEGIRFVLEETWGNPATRLHAFYVD